MSKIQRAYNQGYNKALEKVKEFIEEIENDEFTQLVFTEEDLKDGD